MMGDTVSAIGLATDLARYLSTVGIDRTGAAGRATVRSAIVDTVGVTLVGAPASAVSILAETLGVDRQTPEALLFGRAQRCGLLDAAMLNGVAAHAIDYDDMAHAMGGHPSVPIVPAIMALAELGGRSGRDVVDAYIVGFEAESRLGLVVHPDHYDKGWHPTSTLGVFGAAAAAARLLGLDIEQTARALALCASMASGVKANFGSMTKPFHVGHAVRGGLLAAMLAKSGFTANVGVLEHKQGFFAAYDGLDRISIGRLLPAAGEQLQIETPDFGLKQFPCCGSTHPAILAMLSIVEDGSVDPAAVRAIDIRTHRRRLPHTDNPRPTSALGAKFSVQYATVRALVSGAPRLQHFEGNAFEDPLVIDLLRKTTAAPLENASDEHDQFTAEVRVTLADGSQREGRVAGALGRGPSNPMTDAEMWDKFGDCASLVLAPDAAREAFDLLMDIERLGDVRTLTEVLFQGSEARRPHLVDA